jgi:hypothetical protein
MVAGLCLQDKYQLVGVCDGWIPGHVDRPGNRKLPGNKSSDREPGEEFENRINWESTIGIPPEAGAISQSPNFKISKSVL